jgi:hypothetical protein
MVGPSLFFFFFFGGGGGGGGGAVGRLEVLLAHKIQNRLILVYQ